MSVPAPDLLQTSIGTAVVLHRLAVAVECFDALPDRWPNSPVYADVRAPAGTGRPRPWRPLDRTGTARFTLRHNRPLPSDLVPKDLELRITDPARRFVPRRFVIHPWTRAEVTEPAPYVEVAARLIRPRLWPGSGYPFPRTATVIRGRVMHAGAPVRWPRITAIGPTNGVAGRAHGDDRGEFLLAILDPGQNPVDDTVPIDLVIRAPKTPAPVDPRDPTADLVAEDLPHSANPAAPADLDNTVLRGVATPAGYADNAATIPHLIVPVGAELTLTADVVFDPQP